MAGHEVWYAGYGSNLQGARLLAYLRGGRPPGSSRDHPGARDPRPPTRSVTCTLPGRLAFRGRFASWGPGGAAAFYDPAPDDGDVWARAHRLRRSQLVDLVLQENGLAPLEVASEVRHGVAAALSSLQDGAGASDATAGLELPGAYDLAVAVTARTPDGERLPVVTVTSGAPEALGAGRPPAAYVATILDGLCRDAGLTAGAARAYLADAGVDPDTLDAVTGQAS